MFEFLKMFKFNDDTRVKRIVSSNGVSYVCNDTTRKAINEWIKLVGIDNFSFSDLLCELGFDRSRCLDLKLLSKLENKLILDFKYSDEISKEERIELSYLKEFSAVESLEPNSYGIEIYGGDYKKGYRLIIDKSYENGWCLDIVRDYIEENIGSCIYKRETSRFGFYIIIKNDYFNEIKLYCNKKDSDLKNELELKEYLLNIDNNVRVSDVYKKVCEISLGSEWEWTIINISLKKDNKNVGSIDLHNKWYYRLTGLDYKYELLEDGKRCNFTFDTSIGHMDISFIRDNYNVKIDMSPNDKIFNDKLKLRDYFMNLEFPIKIHELCKDIKDKFFIDLNNIDYFRVETYKDQICGDNLLIKNGKILKFEMNIGDKHLLVGDGLMFYYSSDSLNGLVEVDMYYDNDIVTRYEVALDNGIVNEDMGNVMYNHINSAVYEKVRVRKMINEFLNNDNS